MVDALMAHYWHAIHCVAKTVHRPSFERHLTKFWAAIKAGIEPRISFQAVVFGALLTSVISMPEHRVLAECGVDKHSLIDNFRQGAESALARANFLRTTKLETLQAFVMYLVSHLPFLTSPNSPSTHVIKTWSTRFGSNTDIMVGCPLSRRGLPRTLRIDWYSDSFSRMHGLTSRSDNLQ
jgi:hypothetical protein